MILIYQLLEHRSWKNLSLYTPSLEYLSSHNYLGHTCLHLLHWICSYLQQSLRKVLLTPHISCSFYALAGHNCLYSLTSQPPASQPNCAASPGVVLLNAASLRFLSAALIKASFPDGLPCGCFSGAGFLPKQSRERKERNRVKIMKSYT